MVRVATGGVAGRDRQDRVVDGQGLAGGGALVARGRRGTLALALEAQVREVGAADLPAGRQITQIVGGGSRAVIVFEHAGGGPAGGRNAVEQGHRVRVRGPAGVHGDRGGAGEREGVERVGAVGVRRACAHAVLEHHPAQVVLHLGQVPKDGVAQDADAVGIVEVLREQARGRGATARGRRQCVGRDVSTAATAAAAAAGAVVPAARVAGSDRASVVGPAGPVAAVAAVAATGTTCRNSARRNSPIVTVVTVRQDIGAFATRATVHRDPAVVDDAQALEQDATAAATAAATDLTLGAVVTTPAAATARGYRTGAGDRKRTARGQLHGTTASTPIGAGTAVGTALTATATAPEGDQAGVALAAGVAAAAGGGPRDDDIVALATAGAVG